MHAARRHAWRPIDDVGERRVKQRPSQPQEKWLALINASSIIPIQSHEKVHSFALSPLCQRLHKCECVETEYRSQHNHHSHPLHTGTPEHQLANAIPLVATTAHATHPSAY